MIEASRILVIDDEEEAVSDLEHLLRTEEYEVHTANNGSEGLERLRRHEFDVILTDLRMENVDGMTILKESKERHPVSEVIIVTAYPSLESAIEAMKHGAYHYLSRPYRVGEVRKLVAEAAEKVRLKKEVTALRQDLRSLKQDSQVRLITQSSAVRKTLDIGLKAAQTDCNVLILGESGTGKDLLAGFIHEHSRRRDRPLMTVNCGVFSEELLANELFGHEKGAYTGAVSTKTGILETAAGGTLFLDEITEMSPNMQVKLLRAIQERQIMRVGGTVTIDVDVRFIAATNRDIHKAITDGRFRTDLYYRLNVVSLEIPALKKRKDDIPLLSRFFLMKHAKLMDREPPLFSDDVLRTLQRYNFPGNVRELENIVERAMVLSSGNVIDMRHMPKHLQDGFDQATEESDGDLPTLEENEIRHIKRVLREVGGNKTLASSILGIDRSSLWRKMKRYGLENDPSLS